jgi:hypothetical protein
MVHALSEAKRVLMSGGTLIDLRPIDSPLRIEVFSRGQWIEACALDGSPGFADDVACDKALASAVGRDLRFETRDTFTSTTYWDSVAAFRDNVNEGFRRFQSLGEAALARVDELMRQGGSQASIRREDVMTIARYRRT